MEKMPYQANLDTTPMERTMTSVTTATATAVTTDWR